MKVIPKSPPSTLKKKRNDSINLIDNSPKIVKRKIANVRERERTQSLNNAFTSLKKLIPTMSTDKLSKIQTLKIAKNYIQFLNELLNDEPIEKYQHQEELRRGFSIWRMENEQIFNNNQINQISQVTSSSDFLIKDEFIKEEDKDNYDRELFKNTFDRDDCLLTNVIKQFEDNNLEFISR